MHTRLGLIKFTDVTPGIIEVAKKRTLPHITNLQLIDFDLAQLAVNCYVQGATDMGECMIKRHNLFSQENSNEVSNVHPCA